MLTKSELTKKKSDDAKQLDLVETISSADKLKRKRLLLYIAIFLTIGLSLVFWLYRIIRHIRLGWPSLPSLSIVREQKAPSALDPGITAVLGNSPGWSVAVVAPTVINWSRSQNQLDPVSARTIHDRLSSLQPGNSQIRDYLPQGIITKEEYLTADGAVALHTLVITPQKEILLVISNSTGNEISFRSLLPKLIPLLYWGSI